MPRVLQASPFRLLKLETALRDAGFVLPSPLARMDQVSCVRTLARQLGVTVNSLASDQGLAELLEKKKQHDNSGGGGGGGGYVAKGVHLDGSASLRTNNLVAIDNDAASSVFWIKASAQSSDAVLFVVDPQNTYSTNFFINGEYLSTYYFDATSANSLQVGSSLNPDDSGSLAKNTWICVLASGNTTTGACKVYFNDVDVTTSPGFGSSFVMTYNGLGFNFGDDGFGDSVVGDFADVRFMPGISLLNEDGDIPEVTRRLFIDAGGKPVDPATATASLGAAGAVLFSGDHTSFATNQGTGGTFTLTGALTNSDTSPSD